MAAPIVLQSISTKRFASLDSARITGSVRTNMRRYLEAVKRIMQEDYGRVPPGKTYVRTGLLGDSWVITVSADGAEGTLENTAEYGVFVQGPRGGGRGPGERQAQQLRSRGWKSISDVVRDQHASYVGIMNRSIGPHAGEAE